MPTLTEHTADVLARMLRRLPPSLWDTDPASNTLQRDVYKAFASQVAVWLENRSIARTMTLLLESEGVDLDTLLADYGLKRYLQRPDDYARQIAMQILWTPKATHYAVSTLADLLFELPHLTLRTGRGHVHVLVADTHEVTVPHSYWGLLSDEGLWYAVTVDGTVPTISQFPPPGMDLAPGERPLHWFTVKDAANAPWYVTIVGDTLAVSQAQPVWGTGTTEPFTVLNGLGEVWTMTVDAPLEVLVATEIVQDLPGFGYWDMTDAGGAPYALWMEANVPTIGSAPGGSTNQTPGGTALRWFAVLDEFGGVWYVFPEHGTLTTSQSSPGGVGTTTPFRLMDVDGTRWTLAVDLGEEALVATVIRPHDADVLVLSPNHPYTALQLRDSAQVPWWLSVNADLLQAQLTPTLPTGAVDVTPSGGPFGWLRVTDLAGTLWHAWPSTAGVLTVGTTAPGGRGVAYPQGLGDARGVLWHWGIVAGAFAVSNAPAVDYEGLATAVCLGDADGKHWFWRVRDGRLEWSQFLWPDTIDQSPWGELGWLEMVAPNSDTVYVYPTRQGLPVATLGPPSTSPWGWREPITFRDHAGQRWELVLTGASIGAPEYWRLSAEDGTTRYLWIEAEVPTVEPSPPAGGVDQFPADADWPCLTVLDELAQPWYLVMHGEELFMTPLVPFGTASPVLQIVQDALGNFWSLQARPSTEALITLTAVVWRVRVAPATGATIPLPPAALPIRDAVEAIGHVQAAGSLVTVLIT